MTALVSFSQFSTKFINESNARQHGILATSVWLVAQTIEKISKVALGFFMIGVVGVAQTFLFKESLKYSPLYIGGSFALAIIPKIMEQGAKNFLYEQQTVSNLSTVLAPKTEPESGNWGCLQECYQNLSERSSIISAWSLGFWKRESARKYLATAITIFALHDILNLQWKNPKISFKTSQPFIFCVLCGKEARDHSNFDDRTKTKLLALFEKAQQDEKLLPEGSVPSTLAVYDSLFQE